MWTLTVTILLLAAALPNKASELNIPFERASCEVNNGDCSANAKCIATTDGRICLCQDGFVGNGFQCRPTRLRAAMQRGACPKWKAVITSQLWQRMTEKLDDDRKVKLFQAVIDDIAVSDKTVAAELKSEQLKAASNSIIQASDQFFNFFTIGLMTFSDRDDGRLSVYLEDQAETKSNLARTLLGNAPLVAKSVRKVISRKWKDSENLRGASCFGAFAKTVRSIADKLYVSATCEVDIASGLPEYPIHGHLEFTQPLLGGPTKIEINLRGFEDTNNHGFHVHEFGSTADQCRASGPHFNPHKKKHGGPQDTERHVGDLGNMQPDADGVVMETRGDRLISLFGTNNIMGRVADIHRDEDDLGRGGDTASMEYGNSGPRIACCLIQPLSTDRPT